MNEEKLRERIFTILKMESCSVNSMASSISQQRKLNRQINEGATVTYDVILKIIEKFPQYSINWLLTGNGDMETSNTSTESNDSSLTHYLKNQINDLQIDKEKLINEKIELREEVMRLKIENAHMRSLLENNNIQYQQTS